MYLKAGERLTIRELLYGMLMVSGNDAATALACSTAGSVERFAVWMNQKASALGLTTAHFCNPHGLDAEGHCASALDLARITAAAMEYDLFEQIVASKSVSIAGRTLVNHNKLLWLYEGTCGVKTGYTKSTGRSLVSCCERDGMRLICVTLGAPNDWNDHMRLYDAAWSQYEQRTIVAAGETLVQLPVMSGSTPTVSVQASDEICLPVMESEQVDIRLYLPQFVYADVRKGDILGEACVTVDGEVCGQTNLVAAADVCLDDAQRANWWEKWRLNFKLLFKNA